MNLCNGPLPARELKMMQELQARQSVPVFSLHPFPMPFHKLTLIETVALAVGVLILGMTTLIFWWSLPATVMVINTPLAVHGTVFAPGQLLTYELNYCKSNATIAEVHFTFVDSIAYSTPGMTMSSLPLGCHQVEEALTVPNIPPGTYQLEMVRVYQVRPFRQQTVSAKSQTFQVSAPEPGTGTQHLRIGF